MRLDHKQLTDEKRFLHQLETKLGYRLPPTEPDELESPIRRRKAFWQTFWGVLVVAALLVVAPLVGCATGPLPRISLPSEAISKDCTHLGKYAGHDHDDASIDKWVRSKGGNAVYTFLIWDNFVSAAKCERL
jgi:hypothetical protein